MQKHAKTIQSKLATPFKVEASSSSAFQPRGVKRTDEIVSKRASKHWYKSREVLEDKIASMVSSYGTWNVDPNRMLSLIFR